MYIFPSADNFKFKLYLFSVGHDVFNHIRCRHIYQSEVYQNTRSHYSMRLVITEFIVVQFVTQQIASY